MTANQAPTLYDLNQRRFDAALYRKRKTDRRWWLMAARVSVGFARLCRQMDGFNSPDAINHLLSAQTDRRHAISLPKMQRNIGDKRS